MSTPISPASAASPASYPSAAAQSASRTFANPVLPLLATPALPAPPPACETFSPPSAGIQQTTPTKPVAYDPRTSTHPPARDKKPVRLPNPGHTRYTPKVLAKIPSAASAKAQN